MEINPNNNALSMTGLLPSTQVEQNLNDQVIQNTADIALLNLELDSAELDIATNATNIAINSGAITANATAISNIESGNAANIFIGPCLYPSAANTWFVQLYYQQYMNVSTFDPMRYGVMPYKYKIAKWVFIFDNTYFQPASCWIRIQMKVKDNPTVITTGEAHLTNFQFHNNSIIVSTIYTTEIQHNVKTETYITFTTSQYSGNLNFQAEFIVYPYVYQLLD